MGVFSALFGSGAKSREYFNKANDHWRSQQHAAIRLDEDAQILSCLGVIQNCQLSLEVNPFDGDSFVLMANALLVCGGRIGLDKEASSTLYALALNVIKKWESLEGTEGFRTKNRNAAYQVGPMVYSAVEHDAGKTIRKYAEMDATSPISLTTIVSLSEMFGTESSVQETQSSTLTEQRLIDDRSEAVDAVIPLQFLPEVIGKISHRRGDYFHPNESERFNAACDAIGLKIEGIQLGDYSGPREYTVEYRGSIVASGRKESLNEPWVSISATEGDWQSLIAPTAILANRIWEEDFCGRVIADLDGIITRWVGTASGLTPNSIFEFILIHDVDGLDESVSNGADIEQKSPIDASTPLQYAIDARDFGIAKLLIDKGANIQAVDDEGHTALRRAADREIYLSLNTYSITVPILKL